jgi:hypothetical protein
LAPWACFLSGIGGLISFFMLVRAHCGGCCGMRFCWLLVVGNRGGSCVTLFVAAVAPGRPTGNPDTVLYM